MAERGDMNLNDPDYQALRPYIRRGGSYDDASPEARSAARRILRDYLGEKSLGQVMREMHAELEGLLDQVRNPDWLVGGP